ncbi:MAG: DUF5989 family protein [Planctomycetota bacterium]
MPEKSSDANEFEQEAQGRRMSIIGEFWEFLKHNKKWWLLPILIVLLLMGILVLLSATGIGWAMYTVG